MSIFKCSESCSSLGMMMPGRSFSSNSYRYSYQGQEGDDELHGAGNSINYQYRMYDPRLGRWLSTDPLSAMYPGWSPYNHVLDNPISYVDPDGRWVKGAGFFRNVFKSDARIYAEDAAENIVDAQLTKNEDKSFSVQYMKIRNNGGVAYRTEKYDGTGPDPHSIIEFGMLKVNRIGDAREPTLSDYLSNYSSAAKMTSDWATGEGADYRIFANTSEARAMMNAPDVVAARELFYQKLKDDPTTTSVTNYAAGFGIPGLVRAGADATEQFVGSYSIEIRLQNDRLIFYLFNTTSLKSGGFGVLPDYERSTLEEGGNMRQLYIWAEPLEP